MASKPKKKYPEQNVFTKIYEARLGNEWWAEWKFHPERKWRFDFACPNLKIAIEIDGGIFTRGRHSGGIGQKNDMEKMNAAVELGWRVLHYVPDEQFNVDVLNQIQKVMKNVEENLHN